MALTFNKDFVIKTFTLTFNKTMIKSLFSFIFAAIMWVQVPQWSDDWSKCAVDVPDTACHWYITAPDSTMGEGFSWANAPWFSVEGLLDIGELHDTMTSLQTNS